MEKPTLTKEQLIALVPAEIAKNAMETLKAFDEVYITFERGEWKLSTAICIGNEQASDKQFYVVNSKNIYSEKERALNHINEHREYPHYGFIVRDYEDFNAAISSGKIAVDFDAEGHVVWR